MAEFALGLTKTAVEGTLSRVKSAIEEEATLKVRVQRDLVFITGEFQMMQSFLSVANAERAKNEVVRTWVRQIRDLAFDVEDCVEFVIHLDKKSSWTWLWRLIPSLICAAPPLPLDVAVAQIQNLKARVEDVNQRNTRYNLICESSSNSMPATAAVVSPADQPATTSAFRALNKIWDATGKRCGMGDLQKLITSEGNDLQVISLWGSTSSTGGAADLGMTNIIWKAYDDPEIRQKFKIRAWVKLVHPFNPKEFVKSLLTQFCAVKAPLTIKYQADQLMKMNKHKYLLILEDVSTPIHWDAIRMYLPDTNMGSRIVVSTKQLRVALLCTGDPYQVSELKRVSDDQFVCAFFKQGSGRRSDMGELNWQLRYRGVVSVWGIGNGKSTLIRRVYKDIRSKPLDGLEFKQKSWVDVPDPFNMMLFAVSLLANFYTEDQPDEINAVYSMEEEAQLQQCRKFLREDDCIIVINNLGSTEIWDRIKTTFLSEPTKCCIVITTNEESVATHCVDHGYRALNIKDLVPSRKNVKALVPSQKRVKDLAADTTLHPLITGFGHRSGIGELIWQLRCCGVISVCGTGNRNLGADNERPTLIDMVYKGIVDNLKEFDGVKFKQHSWVDVPEPFDLIIFSRYLCQNFQSDSRHFMNTEKEVAMMEDDPLIEKCRKTLADDDCLVVINGLRRTKDWNMIKDRFEWDFTKNCVVVITNEASVAAHCVDREYRALKIKDLESDFALSLFLKGCQRKEETYQWEHSLDCNRRQEALDWNEKFQLVGRKNEMFKLEDCLKYPGVISVWGIASIGKSALVRSIYCNRMANVREDDMFCDAKVFSQLEFVTYSWVDVPYPFNLSEFSRCLLLDFHSDDLGAKEAAAIGIMEGQDPIQGCCKFLREDKCFVVIDGLRSKDDWDMIKDAFLSEPTTGCIVVITNEASVATYCVDHEHQVLNVKCLEAEASLGLFKKLAWGDNVELTPKMMELSRSTVAKCGGLPEVVAAIGKHPNMPSINLLEYMSDDFMGLLEKDPGFHGLRGLFSWMRSYFVACSDSLKPCIFYLSVFPVDQNIRRMRLLRRWIAEGYSRDTSAGSTAEENGETFFSNLVNLSIIQQPTISKVQCQVNGFFHEYIISRQIEDNLVFALEGHCSLNLQLAGQHLTIRSSWDRDEIVFKSTDFSRLRSLTIFGEWMPFFISADINMKLLRVLDLEDTIGVTHNDIEQIGKRLPHLKFLSLRGCKKISRLPDSLGDLRQLQTLDVRHTKIVTLPRAIIKLQKLQYIRAGTTIPLDEVYGMVVTSLLPVAPPSQDGDGTSTGSLPAAAPPSQDGDGTSTGSLPAAPPPQDGEGTSTSSLPAAAVSPPQDGEGTSTSSLPAAASPPQDGEGASINSPLAAAATPRLVALPSGRMGNRPSTNSVPSNWLSKKLLCTRRRVDDNGGVEVPAGIGNLRALHTLGIVNVNGAHGKAILRELKDLTQLRRLTVSGINRKNWHKFCSAISGHGHLESLSVRVDQEDEVTSGPGCLDDISQLPPKTLKSLKLYGVHLHNIPAWINQLGNLKKLNLDINIATREGVHVLAELERRDILHRLCVKAPAMIQQLHVGMPEDYRPLPKNFGLKVLKIVCTSSLEVSFGFWITAYVERLVVHCSSGSSSLRFSGLENLRSLKEVCLTGSYGEALRQDLQQQLSQHKNEPVFKLPVQPQSSSS